MDHAAASSAEMRRARAAHHLEGSAPAGDRAAQTCMGGRPPLDLVVATGAPVTKLTRPRSRATGMLICMLVPPTTTSLHPLQGVRGARLLALLDALVVRDGASPGAAMSGRVAVGVRCDDGRWVFWRVTPDVRKASTELFNAAPPADVTLVVDADVAESILGTGKAPSNPSVMAVSGNRALFRQFAQRYLEPRSWLDTRVSGAASRNDGGRNGSGGRR